MARSQEWTSRELVGSPPSPFPQRKVLKHSFGSSKEMTNPSLFSGSLLLAEGGGKLSEKSSGFASLTLCPQEKALSSGPWLVHIYTVGARNQVHRLVWPLSSGPDKIHLWPGISQWLPICNLWARPWLNKFWISFYSCKRSRCLPSMPKEEGPMEALV